VGEDGRPVEASTGELTEEEARSDDCFEFHQNIGLRGKVKGNG
jgi:hypothetical protein